MNHLKARRIASNGMLTILSSIILFHILVLTTVIPFEIVWGGRLKSFSQMLSFESASLVINLIMLGVVSIKAGILKVNINPKIIRACLWAMAGLFLLNTAGNLLSNNELEKLLFTPLTLLLSVFSLLLALGKEKESPCY